MCGILGHFTVENNFSADRFARANNIVKYRGPDDFGYITLNNEYKINTWADENLKDYDSQKQIIGGLGFRRLSIIDLSINGHQPMKVADGLIWIVYNGEVYNYVELKNELSELGYNFSTLTDTEVILYSYLEWGKNCLEKFNGMFSFAILDLRKKFIFCARDRFGIKPFYYYFNNKNFLFASEIKQILELLPRKFDENYSVLFDFLSTGSYGNETEETYFNNVYRLIPGYYYLVDISNPNEINTKKIKWWDFNPEELKVNFSEQVIFDNIRLLLEDSIRLRLRSDVTLGTCLSGGLDSSGLVCITDNLLNLSNHKHKVFVIGSNNPEYDETSYAKIIIDKTKADAYFKTPSSEDLQNDLNKFIWHHDEPLIKSSMFGGYHAYKLARDNGVTVVLDGQGSDEIFGGYYSLPHKEFLLSLILQGKLGQFLNQFKINADLSNISYFSLLSIITQYFLRKKAHKLLSDNYHPLLFKSLKGWIKKDFVHNFITKSHVLNKDYLNQKMDIKNEIRAQSYEMTKYTNLPGILRQVDRNSMAFSVEARIPFLDHRLVEYVFSLPAEFLIRNGITKYSYRESMHGIIPEEIRKRNTKVGFYIDERELIVNSENFIADIIDNIPNNSEIFETAIIKKNYKNYLTNNNSYNPIIWRIINCVEWQNIFFKK